ncbi:MAG: hypothetical protein CMF96_01430 [Candidatus Marinimicrobia bacterium]|nr:hypothetical protein [Candidatus Neomarinimicrobiota bacterium]|tara:strand:+ start:2585 stop:3157 length:573 start_codon:yes stop_codon:yes gene_type:complete
MLLIFDYFQKIDIKILEIININLSNPVFDFLMPIIDKPVGFILPVFIFWIFTIFKYSVKRKKILLLIPLVIAFTDQLGYRIKKLEIRERPWVQNEQLNHLGGKGGKQFSFPSNHAANSMAMATVFVEILGKSYWFLFFLAFFSGYSRIYIGVHYPGDVLSGFILGWLVAKMIFIATNKIQSNLVKYHQVD